MLPPVGVDDAEGEVHGEILLMRVQIVDPSAQTPPYDRALAAALARAGAEVELVTSHFVHGPMPPADGYELTESFYRRSCGFRATRPSAVCWAPSSICPECCATAERPPTPTSSITSG